MKKIFALLYTLMIGVLYAQAQNADINQQWLKKLTIRNALPIEKLYLSTDKPYYNSGDTIWFKSYLLNADHTASTRSDKIYVELINQKMQVADRRVVMLNSGLGYGDFTLDSTISNGTYVIRAYSNWQQNFGEDYFFQKSVFINRLTGVKAIQNQAARKEVKTETGSTDQQVKKKTEIDLQFMPEGGFLVQTLYGKVAFKAIDDSGFGIAIKGNILNSKNEVITEFETQHKGMGHFFLLPNEGETYTANYSINGMAYKTKLPDAKPAGTTLRIDALSNPDSVYIYMRLKGGDKSGNYLLTAMAADTEVLRAVIDLSRNFCTLKLPKNLFPDGNVHFTLFSPDLQPLNERQVFLNFDKSIKIGINEPPKKYFSRDSVALDLNFNDEKGNPLVGAFSISVTDDGQVLQKEDTNIQSHFLLTSNIKGKIEEPFWYFQDKELSTHQALDNLMLTQGWIGYKWNDDLQADAKPKFRAENDNHIRGKLTNAFNKPVANLKVTLLSLGKMVFVTDTASDSNGNFVFNGLPLTDSAAYTIKIKNQKGKTSSANITVEHFTQAPLSGIEFSAGFYPGTDTLLQQKNLEVLKFRTEKQPMNFDKQTQILKEVEIKGKNLDVINNSGWDASLFEVITQEDLAKMPRKNLFSLLKERVPGLNIGTSWAPICGRRPVNHSFVNYLVGGSLIANIRIDKINTHIASSGIIDRPNNGDESLTSLDPIVYETNNYIFNNMYADDIKEIRVYRGCVYYYLEITSRSGKGPFLNPARGVYVHKPLPINIAREFYSPKYLPGDVSNTKDLRSTIFWDANVVSDANGKAKVSFYTADLPGSYTIKVEGTDMFGRFGYQTQKLEIRPGISSK